MGFVRHSLLCVALLAFVSVINAGPITYVESGQLSGSLGSTPLTNVSFAFTLVGDTANITGSGTSPDPFLNVALSNTMMIGASSGSFTTTVLAGVSNVTGVIGITDPTKLNGITFPTPGLTGYNLATPISVSNTFASFASGSFATTLGTLAISSAQNLTFTATTSVPEPATLGLSSITLLALGLCFGRRLDVRVRS